MLAQKVGVDRWLQIGIVSGDVGYGVCIPPGKIYEHFFLYAIK